MDGNLEFTKFSKIKRLNRDCIITEKIDGTNAQIFIDQYVNYEEVQWNMINQYNLADEQHIDEYDHFIMAGSRKRWITPEDDNYGFAKWVSENWEALMYLGPGKHFGEWWGQGIQRRYDMDKKIFSLFNVRRYTVDPSLYKPVWEVGVQVVPVLYKGLFREDAIKDALWELNNRGSKAAPGFMDPEGIIIFHTAARVLFKVTLENDEVPKSLVKGK